MSISVAELNKVDQVVILGCGAQHFCLAPLRDVVTDWNFEDPARQPLEEVREIRDEIE